ncbi:hypothetical protein CT0861_09332 [Colletotrichum tofieldiae]|uniref:Uncharacterized protein n=1 Tax=Colletotrichum tofieldiae TaxID=708197 RepID=A0A166RMR8_9PEZI|nr:hypothetical protein CT0861_09332 [Colletotrichum tofieldiae]
MGSQVPSPAFRASAARKRVGFRPGRAATHMHHDAFLSLVYLHAPGLLLVNTGSGHWGDKYVGSRGVPGPRGAYAHACISLGRGSIRTRGEEQLDSQMYLGPSACPAAGEEKRAQHTRLHHIVPSGKGLHLGLLLSCGSHGSAGTPKSGRASMVGEPSAHASSLDNVPSGAEMYLAEPAGGSRRAVCVLSMNQDLQEPVPADDLSRVSLHGSLANRTSSRERVGAGPSFGISSLVHLLLARSIASLEAVVLTVA